MTPALGLSGIRNKRNADVDDNTEARKVKIDIHPVLALDRSSAPRRPIHWRHCTGALEARHCATHVLHLHTPSLLLLRQRSVSLAPSWSKPLVALFVLFLEVQVRRRSRPQEDNNPVLPEVPLREWPMPILFQELVRVEILTGSLSSCHQEEVVAPEAHWVRRNDDTIDHHSKRNAPLVYSVRKTLVFLGLPNKQVGQACPKKKQADQSARTDEDKEIAIIAASNAVVEPDTVMVLCLDTVVTNTTMMGARRAPNIAAFAVLCGYLHSCVR